MAAVRAAMRVRVRRVWVNHRQTWAWMWECPVHVRCRGYHHSANRIDWYRENLENKPPRTAPWVRAIAAANLHWHVYHQNPEQMTCHCRRRRKAIYRGNSGVDEDGTGR